MYHIQWTVKYRRGVLADETVRCVVEECIRAAVTGHGIVVEELSVQAEHVHALVVAPGGMEAAFIVQVLKGGSARRVFERLPWLRRIVGDHLWSPYTFVRPVEEGKDMERFRSYILWREAAGDFRRRVGGILERPYERMAERRKVHDHGAAAS